MTVRVYISGITTEDAMNVCIKHGVDYVGMVFYEISPRNVSFGRAEQLSKNIPSTVKKIAVLVNPDKRLLAEVMDAYKPQYLQLDGEESPEQIQIIRDKYKVGIIKTIYLDKQIDPATIASYESYVDGFVFDSYGNSNMHVDQAENQFNWAALQGFDSKKIWILSGGLNKYNVREAVRMSRAKIICASSTLENTPGIKDPDMLEEFLRISKNL